MIWDMESLRGSIEILICLYAHRHQFEEDHFVALDLGIDIMYVRFCNLPEIAFRRPLC